MQTNLIQSTKDTRKNSMNHLLYFNKSYVFQMSIRFIKN